MPDLIPVKRALLSVSDKTGLVALARALASRGVRLVSTGGTAKALAAAGFDVTPIEAVTGFPEMMDGRVKTLHPKVHGGLLAVRDDPAHLQAMRAHAIDPIDLLCINLYPFERTVACPDVTRDHAIENIDIGGPSMVRSAAKNADWVAVVTDPADYSALIAELDANAGATSLATRRRLQAKAFARTAAYDAAIAAWLAGDPDDDPFPHRLSLTLERVRSLRYGENPHQRAALYRLGPGAAIAAARQLHGKELSYNNVNDAAAALDLALHLGRVTAGRPAACVIKHANPCGAAAGPTPADAVDLAIAGDALAAYGGILALSVPLDAPAAQRLSLKDVFLEVIVAPAFDDDALDLLRSRSANVRLLRVEAAPGAGTAIDFRSIPGGVLAQTRDDALAGDFGHRAGPPPSEAQLGLARFLEPVCRALTSNAVCIGSAPAGRFALVGAGAGQMDRLQACRIAVEKSGDRSRGGVAFSDAFFPFPDAPGVLIDAGVSCLVHPGGSKRDDDTFALCREKGVTCLTTGLRHFRH
ncbi:MAG: bifunctional phosphoribosylaminoimidazolecarboxamide formyltransferase/IMP cyclohydrolase [Phycisphaerae bacterium]|nr:bifunctional phosphoribosylaminoimidazolecarboxamide formyltransferase/IMP cyclohydrolase [Phycisphaerae bacterium]